MQDESPKAETKDAWNGSEFWRAIKNTVVLGVAFMVHFTAKNGAANLQSSINAEAGLGTASLAAVQAGIVVSDLFLPVIIIKWLGKKWTIAISFLTFMPYIVAQMKPSFYTLIPAGLLVGLGSGPLWCAKNIYLFTMAEAHSKISKVPAEALQMRFMGLFFMIFSLNQLWGNLISSLVLRSGNNTAAVTSLNASMIPEMCGANFLPVTSAKKVLAPQPPEKIQLLSGRQAARPFEVDPKEESRPSSLALLADTLKLVIEPSQLLLVVITIFHSNQHSFFVADVTAAFVSCAIGTGSIGFVMICFGIANSSGYIITGYLAKITGRIPLICVQIVVQFALSITFLTWRPQADAIYVIYIIAVLWGICDSILAVVLNSYFGILFPDRLEGTYSILQLWKAVGSTFSYAISPYLSIRSKIYLMMTLMVVGGAGYFATEIRVRRSKE